MISAKKTVFYGNVLLFIFSNKLLESRWFKVTFWFPSWRSLSPLKGHLTIPKRSQRIARIDEYPTMIESLPASGERSMWKTSSFEQADLVFFFLNLNQSANGCCCCWFGARWFGFLGFPYEKKSMLLKGTLRIPNHQPKPTINYLLIQAASKLLLRKRPQRKSCFTCHICQGCLLFWCEFQGTPEPHQCHPSKEISPY